MSDAPSFADRVDQVVAHLVALRDVRIPAAARQLMNRRVEEMRVALVKLANDMRTNATQTIAAVDQPEHVPTHHNHAHHAKHGKGDK